MVRKFSIVLHSDDSDPVTQLFYVFLSIVVQHSAFRYKDRRQSVLRGKRLKNAEASRGHEFISSTCRIRS